MQLVLMFQQSVDTAVLNVIFELSDAIGFTGMKNVEGVDLLALGLRIQLHLTVHITLILQGHLEVLTR